MLEKLKEVRIDKRISKNDKEYTVLVLVFTNGKSTYIYESFLNNEQTFILENI